MTAEGVFLRYIPPLRIYDGSTGHKLILTTLAFIFEFLVFCFVFIASKCSSTTFRNLKPAHRVFWCLAGVRGFFGIRSVILAPFLWMADQELLDDIVFGKTLSSQFLIATIVGFFVFECSLLLVSDLLFHQRSYALLAHHSISLIAYSMGLILDQGHFLGMLIVTLEMSTPFTCLCWVLIKAKLSKTFIWKANQFLLIHLFHTRQNVLCAMLYFVIKDWVHIYQHMNPLIVLLVVGGSFLMILGLNPYWTYRKTEQFFSGEDWNFQDAVQCPDEKNGKVHSNGKSTANGTVHSSAESGNNTGSRKGNSNLNSPIKKNGRNGKQLKGDSPRSSKKQN